MGMGRREGIIGTGLGGRTRDHAAWHGKWWGWDAYRGGVRLCLRVIRLVRVEGMGSREEGAEFDSESDVPPGNANGGGIIGCPPGFCPSMGLDADWPSAAYEEVIESMTDWAFSWPISAEVRVSLYSVKMVYRGGEDREIEETHVGSSPQHYGGGFARYYAPCARSSSRA